MTTYSYNKQRLLRLFKFCIQILSIGIFIGAILYFLEYLPLPAYLLFLGVMTLGSLPTVFIAWQYYKENRNTQFSIDYKTKSIYIKHKHKSKTYAFDQIRHSTYHIAIYHRNRLDKRHRREGFLSAFAYWDVEFKNGDRFYLSNILFDAIHAPLLSNISTFRYCLIPYIRKNVMHKGFPKAYYKPKKLSLEAHFRHQFRSKTKAELHYIINHPKSYQKEAVQAAKFLYQNTPDRPKKL